MSYFRFLIVIIFILALFSNVGTLDSISLWVAYFVDTVPWFDFWKPYRLPEPMKDPGFRPLSILFVKLGLLSKTPMWDMASWVIALKNIIVMEGFAIGLWFWLREIYNEKVTFGLSLLIMISEMSVFSAANYTEFDGLGAGFILLASVCLTKRRPYLFVLFFAIPVFLKESSALVAIFFLFPQLWQQYRLEKKIPLSFLLGCGVLFFWFLGVFPMIFGQMGSRLEGAPLSIRLAIMQYTSWQLLALLTETGAILLVGTWFWRKNRLLGRIVTLVIIIWSMVEPLRVINHFQTHYYSRASYVSFLIFVLLIILLEEVIRRGKYTILAQQILFMLVGFGGIILVSSSLREDLAARLFFALAAPLFVFMWESFQEVRKDQWFAPMSYLLFFGTVWYNFVSAGDYLQKIHTEQGKCLQFFVNESDEVEDNSLLFLSAPDVTFTGDIVFKDRGVVSVDFPFFSPAFFSTSRLLERPVDEWTEQPIHREEGQSVFFFRQYRKTRMTDAQKDFFHRDFSWIQIIQNKDRIEGVEQNPVDLTETKEARELREAKEREQGHIPSGGEMPAENEVLPHLSLLKDLYFREYPTEKSYLDQLLEEGFFPIEMKEYQYYSVTPRLLEIPIRLWNGVPLVETKVFRQELWRLHE